MILSEERDLLLRHEDPADVDERTPVAEPTLHLHLRVGRRVVGVAGEQSRRQPVEREATTHNVARHEDGAEVWRGPPAVRLAEGLENGPVGRAHVAVDHRDRGDRDDLIQDQPP